MSLTLKCIMPNKVMRVGIIVWIEIYSQLDLDGHLYTHLAHDFILYSVKFTFLFHPPFPFFSRKRKKVWMG